MGTRHKVMARFAGCAIETSITITLGVTVIKDMKSYVQTPHFRTAPTPDTKEKYYGTTGINSDIREAARDAVRHMIAFLVREFGLNRQEAYMLCSIVGDLKLHEVVDMPNYVVGFLVHSREKRGSKGGRAVTRAGADRVIELI